MTRIVFSTGCSRKEKGVHSLDQQASLIAQLVKNPPAMQETQFVAQLVKNPSAMQETWFDSWVKKIRWRRESLPTPVFLGFPGGSVGKESACNVGDLEKIPWRRKC